MTSFILTNWRIINLMLLTITTSPSITLTAAEVINSGPGQSLLLAGNDLTAKALSADAKGNLILQAGNDLILSAGQNTLSLDQASHHTAKSGGLLGSKRSSDANYQIEQSQALTSTLSGQNVSLSAGRDLSLEGGQFSAQQKLSFAAGRTLTLAAGESFAIRSERHQTSTQQNLGGQQSLKTTRDETTITPDVAQLNAPEVSFQSGGAATLVAPQMRAAQISFDIGSQFGGQLSLTAATAVHELKESSEFKSNRFNLKEITNPRLTGARVKDKIKLSQSASERRAVVADIEANSVDMQAAGDTLLVAPQIKAEHLSIQAGTVKGEVVDPHAKTYLSGVKESTGSSSSKNSHSFIHETIHDSGSQQESLKLPVLVLGQQTGNDNGNTSTSNPDNPPLKLALAAPGGIVVGVTALAPTQREQATNQGNNKPKPAPPAGTPYDLRAQAAALAQQPGLAWLGELTQRNDVDWQKIELAQKNWDYKHAGLTQEGAAVVTIVVTILTMGAASSLGAAVGGSVGSATGSAVAATAVSAATSAAVATLASQAAVSLINNQGDVDKTLHDLGSKDSVKQVLASMLTAGVGGYYSSAYNLESLLAKTAAGCAVGELTGSGCGQGAAVAGAMAGLAWASEAMKQNQIENSKQFKGICLGDSNQCSDNYSRGEIGGGRWDVAKVCRTEGFSCTVREDGYVSIIGNGVETMTDQNVFDVLQAKFKKNGGDLLSPMGGHQGREVGYLKMFGVGPGDYGKNSFWSKWVVEPFGGPHDFGNSFSAYDTVNGMTGDMKILGFDGKPHVNPLTGIAPDPIPVPRFIGNIRPDYGGFANFMNVINIPLAAPFAAGALVEQLPPGTLQILQNAQKEAERNTKKPQEQQP